jgi:hypothetical protein
MYNLEVLRNIMPSSKVKLSLGFSFLFLVLFQAFVGFKYFDDYLVVFLFILFLNDQFNKLKNPEQNYLLLHERKKRIVMTFIFLSMIFIPFILDLLHVPQSKLALIYKLGFIIWAQIFLIDAFNHYKETHSKKWLLFANTAVCLIVAGAFIF